MSYITDTYNAALTTIIRQALGELEPRITQSDAVKQIRRAQLITACSRFGPVPEGLNDKQLTRHAVKLGLEPNQ